MWSFSQTSVTPHFELSILCKQNLLKDIRNCARIQTIHIQCSKCRVSISPEAAVQIVSSPRYHPCSCLRFVSNVTQCSLFLTQNLCRNDSASVIHEAAVNHRSRQLRIIVTQYKSAIVLFFFPLKNKRLALC